MNTKTRILGIDFGLKRIGLALSDELKMLATRIGTLKWNGADTAKPIAEIAKIVSDNNVEKCVLGLPLRLDGKESEVTSKTREFQKQLSEALQIDVVLTDERYTSKIASMYIREAGAKKRSDHSKGLVDTVSAEIILQDYLDRSI